MEGRFFLDVVIGKCSTVFQLLSSENESLLLWRNSLFVLNLGLDILDRVVRLDVQGDSFSSQSLDENLHGTTSKTKDKVKSGLFLNVVV